MKHHAAQMLFLTATYRDFLRSLQETDHSPNLMNNFYNRRLVDKSPAFLHYFTGSLYSLAGSRSLTFLLYGDFFIQKKKKSSVMNFGTARFHFIIFSQGLHVLTLKISIQPKNQAHFSYFQVSKIS